MNDYKFGNFLCMLREGKSMTQADIAGMVGVTPAAVSKWENGSSKPRVEVLFQLAKILEVRPEELIAGEFLPDDEGPAPVPPPVSPKKPKKRLFWLLAALILLLLIALSLWLALGNGGDTQKPTSTGGNHPSAATTVSTTASTATLTTTTATTSAPTTTATSASTGTTVKTTASTTRKPTTTAPAVDTFVPDCSADQANEAGNVGDNLRYGASYLAKQGDWYYFTSSTGVIRKMHPDGSGLTKIYEVPEGEILYLNVCGNWIYFYVDTGEEEGSYIAKIRTDGSRFTTVVDHTLVGTMLVVQNKIYYTVTFDSCSSWAKEYYPLYAVSINGGTPVQLHDGYVSDLYYDGNRLYFLCTVSSGGQSKLYAMNLNGSGKTVLRSSQYLRCFTISNGTIYMEFRDAYGEGDYCASMTTSGTRYTELTKVGTVGTFIVVKNGKLYYLGRIPWAYYDTYGELCEQGGLIEYNPSTKAFRLLRRISEDPMSRYALHAAGNRLIAIERNYAPPKELLVFDTAGNLLLKESFL